MKDPNAPMTHGEFQTMLDHITSERLKGQNYVHEEMEKVNNKVDALQTGVSNLKRDMTQVKQDVSTLKTDMTQVKQDVSTLKTDMTQVKQDVSTLKTDMTEVKEDVSTIATELGIEIAKKQKAS